MLQRMLSALILAATVPLLLVVALGIYAHSPGPILLRQSRTGLGGRAFGMWKLRTMVPDAEARLADLIRRDERAAAEWAAYGRLAGDPRIAGPFGRWARKLSIDELPQLLNVVAGQMRLVGPRPILLRQAQEMPEWQLRIRQSVPPGMTGLWQVCGRSETTLRQMVRLDLLYVRRRGHCTDLYILLRTPGAVLWSRGAY